MSFLKRWTNPIIRSLGDYFWNEYYGSGQTWLGKGTWGANSQITGDKVAISDTKITPNLLVEVCRSQVIYAIKNTIRAKLKQKPYYFKGGKNTAKQLKEILQSADYDKFVSEWFEAMLGTGGGNCLAFISDGSFVCEPFNTEGKTRVQVLADYDNREILGYQVVNSNLLKLAEYSPRDVFHERYSEEGDFRFAINPAVVATRYYVIERKAFGALENGFENIINAKRFVSPKLDYIKDMNSSEKGMIFERWREFKDVLSTLPGFLASPLPMDFQNMTLTIEEMQTKDILTYLDVVMAGAYSSSLSIIGRSDGVNYANGEQNTDNFYELAVETIKVRIERITMQLMERLLPDYDPVKNPFKFCKEYNEEDIQLRDQSLVTLEKILPAIQAAGYRVKQESVSNVLSQFGLELEDSKPVVENVEETQEVRKLNRQITKSEIKAVENIENTKEIEETKEKIFLAILNQIKDAKIDSGDVKLKKIESYLNLDGFKKVLKKVVKNSINIYNQNYETDYTMDDLPETLSEFIELFAKVLIYGWQGVKTDNYSEETLELVNIPKDYSGIDSTTQETLTGKKETDLEVVTKNRQATIWEGILLSAFDITQKVFAGNDGREYLGVITKNDSRVRDKHRVLHMKFAEQGQIPDPTFDFGCRCTKYYGKTEKEMLGLGFTRF